MCVVSVNFVPHSAPQSGDAKKTTHELEQINPKSSITNPQSEVPHPTLSQSEGARKETHGLTVCSMQATPINNLKSHLFHFEQFDIVPAALFPNLPLLEVDHGSSNVSPRVSLLRLSRHCPA